MKKLVVLSPSQVQYVEEVAKAVSTPGHSNFSKGLRHIIDEHKWKTNTHTSEPQ
jgi:hypothetical protein